MTYKLIFSVLLTGLLFGNSDAQRFSKDFWHPGEVDLTNDQTIKGMVKYDLQADNIVFKAGNMVRSLNATKVVAWQIIDAQDKQIRYFFTLPFSRDGSSYKKPTFFELLTEGDELTLLTREEVVDRVENQYDPYWFGGRNVRVTVEQENYFFMNGKGDIAACRTDLENVLKFMKGKEKDIQKFVKANRLDIERREHMIQVVDYYNSLKASQ